MVSRTTVLVDENGNRYVAYGYWNGNNRKWILNVNGLDNDFNPNYHVVRLGNSLRFFRLVMGRKFLSKGCGATRRAFSLFLRAVRRWQYICRYQAF